MICWNCNIAFERADDRELCNGCYTLRMMRREPLTRGEILADVIKKHLWKYIGHIPTSVLREQIKTMVMRELSKLSFFTNDIVDVEVSWNCEFVTIDVQPKFSPAPFIPLHLS